MQTKQIKRRLSIDLDELIFAAESAWFDGIEMMRPCLDLETGEVISIPTDEMRIESGQGAEPLEIYEDSSRYLPIPTISPRDGWEDMAAFSATVGDPHLRDLLEVALDGKGAFGRFKSVLLHYPDDEERWHAFKKNLQQQRMLAWLASQSIELIAD